MRTKELYTNHNSSVYVPTELEKYSRDVFSQNGEDGILEEICKRVKIKNNFFVEFGGWDAEKFSNSANLRINKSWGGILFEGDQDKVKQARKEVKIYNEFVTSKNVNDLFEKYNVPSSFGLLSIDIDGDDPYVLESLDTNKFSPDIIIIEFNPGLPNHIPIRIIEQGLNQTAQNVSNGYFSANINSIYEIAKLKNYEFVTTVSWNLIFIKEELFDQLNIERKTKDIILEKHINGNGTKPWLKAIQNNDFQWVIK